MSEYPDGLYIGKDIAHWGQYDIFVLIGDCGAYAIDDALNGRNGYWPIEGEPEVIDINKKLLCRRELLYWEEN